MIDFKNEVGDALDKYVSRSRVPWSAIVVGTCAIYLLARFIPWAAHGFPVVGR